jgi:hypothetical protein
MHFTFCCCFLNCSVQRAVRVGEGEGEPSSRSLSQLDEGRERAIGKGGP